MALRYERALLGFPSATKSSEGTSLGDRNCLPTAVPNYFSPPPAELAEPLALLAGLFLPPIELALFVPPALLLIIFDDDLRGLASATLTVKPAAIVATARTERNFFILGLPGFCR